MALPACRSDREYQKFVETASGDVALRCKLDGDISIENADIGDINITDYNTNKETKSLSALGTSSSNVTFSQDVTEIFIQNQSDTNDVYVKLEGGTATADQDSIKLVPGASLRASQKIAQATGISLIASGASTPVFIQGYWTS